MLGEDESSDEERLTKFLGEVDWTYLKPHYERGNLYFVDAELELVEVGAAFAKDASEEVKVWLKNRDVMKIEALHASQWEEGNKTVFRALVVSPFVLCQIA